MSNRLFGLIGHPLTHSFSKKYFTEKFLKENIKGCSYELFDIDNINLLPEIIAAHPHLKGLNVTIPYKKQVIPFLSNTAYLPQGLMACNCIKIDNGNFIGYNTDVVGFEQSFLPLLQPHHKKALVLGNGGATGAVTYVLQQLNIPYHIVSRQAVGDNIIGYNDITADVLEAATVIINTTPLGTYPNVENRPDIPYQYLTPRHYLFDLVYNPEKTLFLQSGEAAGAAIKNGADMLVIQAEESWKIWNDN